MRSLATASLALLLSLIPLNATAQTTQPEKPAVTAQKPAWEWTLEERIAKRLDPAAIRERTQATERDDIEKDGFTPEVVATMGFARIPIRFTVEGRRDPELLMPSELFGSILGGVDAVTENRQGTRRFYREEIRESGWDEEIFWQTLEEASAEMMKTQEERLALLDKAESLPLADRRTLVTNAEDLGRTECGLRADAMQAVRRKFGAEKFDRFLYEKVAPNVEIGSDFPFGNEEWRLRYIEGGCR